MAPDHCCHNSLLLCWFPPRMLPKLKIWNFPEYLIALLAFEQLRSQRFDLLHIRHIDENIFGISSVPNSEASWVLAIKALPPEEAP